ncbi:hypothetical protein G5S52_22615 [Grimontia sp. S25]|uniref:Uncharacterized protein n=1 Tax=Grimontia sedimenti TaxID=2711294 RepID=A0A6M1RQV5_9GAMM|nr:hypothetical protein [Grimontia sedimenti]NGO00309.1 hypothetical protein [Grimontia sedimenti]
MTQPTYAHCLRPLSFQDNGTFTADLCYRERTDTVVLSWSDMFCLAGMQDGSVRATSKFLPALFPLNRWGDAESTAMLVRELQSTACHMLRLYAPPSEAVRKELEKLNFSPVQLCRLSGYSQGNFSRTVESKKEADMALSLVLATLHRLRALTIMSGQQGRAAATDSKDQMLASFRVKLRNVEDMSRPLVGCQRADLPSVVFDLMGYGVVRLTVIDMVQLMIGERLPPPLASLEERLSHDEQMKAELVRVSYEVLLKKWMSKSVWQHVLAEFELSTGDIYQLGAPFTEAVLSDTSSAFDCPQPPWLIWIIPFLTNSGVGRTVPKHADYAPQAPASEITPPPVFS